MRRNALGRTLGGPASAGRRPGAASSASARYPGATRVVGALPEGSSGCGGRCQQVGEQRCSSRTRRPRSGSARRAALSPAALAIAWNGSRGPPEDRIGVNPIRRRGRVRPQAPWHRGYAAVVAHCSDHRRQPIVGTSSRPARSKNSMADRDERHARVIGSRASAGHRRRPRAPVRRSPRPPAPPVPVIAKELPTPSAGAPGGRRRAFGRACRRAVTAAASASAAHARLLRQEARAEGVVGVLRQKRLRGGDPAGSFVNLVAAADLMAPAEMVPDVRQVSDVASAMLRSRCGTDR
jgi:hypothetical protein